MSNGEIKISKELLSLLTKIPINAIENYEVINNSILINKINGVKEEHNIHTLFFAAIEVFRYDWHFTIKLEPDYCYIYVRRLGRDGEIIYVDGNAIQFDGENAIFELFKACESILKLKQRETND